MNAGKHTIFMLFLLVMLSFAQTKPAFHISNVGDNYIEFTADSMEPGSCPESDFWIILRSPMALFIMGELPYFSESIVFIDPIEDFAGHSDIGEYKWSNSNVSYDLFLDSLATPICLGNPDINCCYTALAVDTGDSGDDWVYSDFAEPVGEYDHYIYPGTNILTYPVDIGCSTAVEMGEILEDFGVSHIYKWEPQNQIWVIAAIKHFVPFPLPGHTEWIGNDTLVPGSCFRADKTEGSGVEIWSLNTPGYITKDADLPVHELYSGEYYYIGKNLIMMPFQRYNLFLATNIYLDSLNVVRAENLLSDIGCGYAYEIYRFNGFTQTPERIAFWFAGIFPIGLEPIYPGAPYIVYVEDDCDWPVEY